MKFNWKLEYHENLKRWETHSNLVGHSSYSDLTLDEKIKMEALNQRLIGIERRYYPPFKAKFLELARRVADPDDWLEDFNLELWITYFLREDDPEWEENCDNILTASYFLYNRNEDWGFGCLGVNHAESPPQFAGQSHCFTYHELYDHLYLAWRDLLRIGTIGIEIKIDEQVWETVTPI